MRVRELRETVEPGLRQSLAAEAVVDDELRPCRRQQANKGGRGRRRQDPEQLQSKRPQQVQEFPHQLYCRAEARACGARIEGSVKATACGQFARRTFSRYRLNRERSPWRAARRCSRATRKAKGLVRAIPFRLIARRSGLYMDTRRFSRFSTCPPPETRIAPPTSVPSCSSRAALALSRFWRCSRNWPITGGTRRRRREGIRWSDLLNRVG